VSLRNCPDCGREVSASALACPYCGRPNRKASAFLGIAGALVFVAAGVAAVLWLSGRYRETSAESKPTAPPPETLVAQPYRQLERSLTTSIGYNRKLYVFRIENRD